METLQASTGKVEYRHDVRSKLTALIFNGGHTTAALHDGEEYFVARNYSILSVTRPGYGETDEGLGKRFGDFEHASNELIEHLGIESVIAVGISAGGRAAMRLAELHPDKVDKIILMSATSFDSWPDTKMRMAAYVAFNPALEAATWTMTRWFLRKKPQKTIEYLFDSLTKLNAREVLASYPPEPVEKIRDMFMQFRSGSGFMNDISNRSAQGHPESITQPTLILHSKNDGAVPLDHPHRNAEQIKNSTLSINDTESHLMWISPKWTESEKVLDNFLS